LHHLIPKSIYRKEKLSSILASLEQFVSGLETYGLLNVIRSNKSLFAPIFCQSDLLKWKFDVFGDLLDPQYGETGSSKKSSEINTMKAFNDAMESIFYEERGVSFPAVMKFLTGAKTVPPLGMPKNIQINFKHGCNAECKCKLYVSTCALSLTLPCHYKTKDEMVDVIVDSVRLSRGFDAL